MEMIIETLDQAVSYEDLEKSVLQVRDAFDVDHSVYHSVNHVGDPYALFTYEADWANHYESEGLVKIDPVVKMAFQRFHPYSWKSLDWTSKPTRRLFHEALDGGVGNQGLSLPVRGPSGEFALLSLSHHTSDEKWKMFSKQNMSNLLLLGHYIHEAARRIEFGNTQRTYTNLSPREADALSYLAAGVNRARIAEALGISEHTLRVYIESARFKLGAANTTHAVAKALSQGLIAI